MPSVVSAPVSPDDPAPALPSPPPSLFSPLAALSSSPLSRTDYDGLPASDETDRGSCFADDDPTLAVSLSGERGGREIERERKGDRLVRGKKTTMRGCICSTQSADFASNSVDLPTSMAVYCKHKKEVATKLYCALNWEVLRWSLFENQAFSISKGSTLTRSWEIHRMRYTICRLPDYVDHYTLVPHYTYD